MICTNINQGKQCEAGSVIATGASLHDFCRESQHLKRDSCTVFRQS